MNKNALSKKSSIRIKKTDTGKTTLGTPKVDGYTMPSKEYYAQLRRNGYRVEQTPNGVIISKG